MSQTFHNLGNDILRADRSHDIPGLGPVFVECNRDDPIVAITREHDLVPELLDKRAEWWQTLLVDANTGVDEFDVLLRCFLGSLPKITRHEPARKEHHEHAAEVGDRVTDRDFGSEVRLCGARRGKCWGIRQRAGVQTGDHRDIEFGDPSESDGNRSRCKHGGDNGEHWTEGGFQ